MKETVLQYVATISAGMIMCSGAVVNMWASPMLPQLLSIDSPIGVTITKEEGTLVTSLTLFGSILGNVILGPCITFFGRRGTLLLTSIPIFLCWFLIIFARSVTVLYIARFIQGIFVAAAVIVPVLYVGEISSAPIRGRVSLILNILSDSTNIATITLGSFLSYQMLGVFGAIFPVLFFISFYWMPESPYYYLKDGDLDKAEKSLKMFRGGKDVIEELTEMKKTIDGDFSEKGSFLDLFRVKRYRIGILTILGLKTLHQMSGTTAINSYMKIIFEDSKTGLNADTSSIISISVGLPSVVLASLSVDKFGRKPLYYLATLGTMSALLIESTYFFLQKAGHLDESNPFVAWMPTIGIFLFQCFKNFGLHSLPALLLGEIFPAQVKGYATSVCWVYGSTLASLVSYGFPGFSDKFGYGVSFVIFAAFCFSGFWFVKFMIPETKRKTLAAIQTAQRENKIF